MPAMMVRYAGPKVFVALQETEGLEDEGEGSEEDEEVHFGVIEEAPKPSLQPMKERPTELGSRWKKPEARKSKVLTYSVASSGVTSGSGGGWGIRRWEAMALLPGAWKVKVFGRFWAGRLEDLGSREVLHCQEEDWEAPEGARLWGWTMQPVKETEEFPELSKEKASFRYFLPLKATMCHDITRQSSKIHL